MDVLDNVWILICYFVEFLEKEAGEWTWRNIGNGRANVIPVLVSKTITYAELCDKVRELLEVDARLNDIEIATIVPGMTNVPIPPMTIDCDNNVKWYLSVCREAPLYITLLKKDVEYEENDGLRENKEHATIVVHDNSLNEGRVTTETSPSKSSPTEEPKLDQTTPLSEEKSVPDPISSKRSDVGSDGISKREPSAGSAFSVSQATNSVSESVVLPQLVSAADKPKEASDSHPFFSCSSETLNEVPSSAFSCLSSEPFTWSESKQENSSSLVNVASAATGARLVTFGSDKGGQPNSRISGDTNVKSGTALSVTSNGPHFSSSPAFSSAAASASDTNQISIESSSLFTSSTSISTTSTSGASTSSVFGSTVKPSFSALPAFKFGSFVDPSSTVVSLASATTISESRDLKTKLEKASPGNDQMDAEDNMIEDTIQSSAASVPVFGQPTVSPSASGFMFGFGSTVPSLPKPTVSPSASGFMFGFGSTVPSVPKPTVSPSASGFMFGSTVPSLPKPTVSPSASGFMFGSTVPRRRRRDRHLRD